MKNNKAILGYDSIVDFFYTNFGFSSIKLNIITVLIASITSFTTSYIWDDARAYYFLVFCLFIDFITGVWKAFTNKTFASKRMPRMLVTVLLYSLMLSLSWNAAKSSMMFIWLPAAMYGGFLCTTLVSIFENINTIGFLPSGMYILLKQRLKIEEYFNKDVTKKKEEETKS